MYRCKGRTTDGKRCKRKLSVLDGFCPTHNDRLGVPLEVDMLTIEEKPVECFKDEDPAVRDCGHHCDLTHDRCCACLDARPADTLNRATGYCAVCKTRLAKPAPAPVAARAQAPRNYVRLYRNRRLIEEEEEDNRIFRFFVAHYAAQARAEGR